MYQFIFKINQMIHTQKFNHEISKFPNSTLALREDKVYVCIENQPVNVG